MILTIDGGSDDVLSIGGETGMGISGSVESASVTVVSGAQLMLAQEKVIINTISDSQTLLLTLLLHVSLSYAYQTLNPYRSAMVWAVWKSEKEN